MQLPRAIARQHRDRTELELSVVAGFAIAGSQGIGLGTFGVFSSSMSTYAFPDEDTLVRYLAMLRDVLIDARLRAYAHDPQTAELLDAVENVPDLLARWPDMKTDIVEADLARYEAKYLDGAPRYTGTLRDGPQVGWQLKPRR
jgi:hypothetical protein